MTLLRPESTVLTDRFALLAALVVRSGEVASSLRGWRDGF